MVKEDYSITGTTTHIAGFADIVKIILQNGLILEIHFMNFMDIQPIS